MKNIQKHLLPVAVLLSFAVLVTLVIALSIKENTRISANRTSVPYTSSAEPMPVEEDMIPLSEEAMEELEYEDIVTEDEYEDYYLYNFLYIGDSFIQRLAKSGIIHESNDVLAKNGTAARDWYVEEGNDRYVDFYDRMLEMDPDMYSGIVVNYGINDIKNSTDVEFSEQLIDDIAKQFPGTPIFLMKIMPVAEQFVLEKKGKVVSNCDDINRGGKYNVTSFNNAMEDYARRKENVWFVDATEGFIDENGNLMREKADKRGLHIANEYVVEWCKNIFYAVTNR
ncbi:MAG: SGNH/GDSL hydrolase family protein [Lachnospiraceae bacterium]|nr:SGNH/GDSL hydrolase family protein [Lachnospiraceae bacterium]